MKALKLEKPADVARVESGVIEFVNDWPGVFIRGDKALHVSFLLRQALKTHTDPITKAYLISFCEFLESCRVKND